MTLLSILEKQISYWYTLSAAATQMPAAILQLVEAAPGVKQWMTDTLHVTDWSASDRYLQHTAPAVRQLHPHPCILGLGTARGFLANSFNMPEEFPDAVVSVGHKDIYIHRLVVAKGCDVLARRWGPLWEGNRGTLALDEMMSCQACSIKASHSTALMFFAFFYTGTVAWPAAEEKPVAKSALELLVMASVYNIPYLVCEAEIALRHYVTVENSCTLLEIADHHQAQQLRRLCVQFIANGHKLVSKTEGFRSLSPELCDEVDMAKEDV